MLYLINTKAMNWFTISSVVASVRSALKNKIIQTIPLLFSTWYSA